MLPNLGEGQTVESGPICRLLLLFTALIFADRHSLLKGCWWCDKSWVSGETKTAAHFLAAPSASVSLLHIKRHYGVNYHPHESGGKANCLGKSRGSFSLSLCLAPAKNAQKAQEKNQIRHRLCRFTIRLCNVSASIMQSQLFLLFVLLFFPC